MARSAVSTMMVASLLVLGALLFTAPVSANAGSAMASSSQQMSVEFAHRQLLQVGMGMALMEEESGEKSADEESGEILPGIITPSPSPMEEESREESREESKDEESKMDSTDHALRLLVELNRKMLRV